MSYQVVDSDPSKVTDINVGIDSPHVVTFRIWYRNPEDEKWTRIGEGQTADDSPDYFQTGPLGDETRLAYYLIIVGNAFTSFSATVTLSQEGRYLPGGTCIETGRLTETRREVRERKLVLK